MPDALNRLFLSAKKTIAANLPFVILIAILFGYLTARALPENHMDMDSAIMLLNARWWARDGFLKNYFLPLNAGYGKIIRYFDEPELSDHAHGSTAGGLIGHKIYYTHYPSLYIVPIALLVKLGITRLFFLRILSIVASILSIVFLYAFIKKLLSNKYIALIAAAYFGISPIFIKWGDSLQYIPQEDFWRFLILLSSLIIYQYFNNSQKWTETKNKYLYLSAIWLGYFFLALTSFNSTIFIFIWLAGLSLLYVYKNQAFKIKNRFLIFIFLTLFWSFAPILGFALQLVQNISYLGWHNAWLDIYSAVTGAGNRAGLGFTTRIEGIIKPFLSATGLLNIYAALGPLGLTKIKNFFIQSRISILYILLLLIGFGAIIIVKLRKIADYKIPRLYIVSLLAIAPLAQTFFLPLTGYRDNMGRLAAPFVGIIIGVIFWMLYLAFLKIKSLSILNKGLLIIISLAVIILFTIQIALNFIPNIWPTYAPIAKSDIAFAKAMQEVATGEKAVFMINALDTQIPEEELKKRWSQYDPASYNTNYMIWEYYFDMPLLNFTKNSYVIRDLLYLEKRAEFPFTAIITSDDLNLINELYKDLKNQRLRLSDIKILQNRYYFIVNK